MGLLSCDGRSVASLRETGGAAASAATGTTIRDLTAKRIGLTALAETWSTGGSGQGDAASFLDHLGTFVDAFIAEYRRVRDSEARREAGKPRPPTPDSQSGG